MRSARFPGGLRAQIVVGLSAMLVATVALGGLVVQNMLVRRLMDERHDRAVQLANVAAELGGASLNSLGQPGVVVLVVGEGGGQVGPDATIDALRDADARRLTVDGHTYAVGRAAKKGRVAIVAVELDTVAADVADSRRVLGLFVGGVAVFVLLLGTGFLTFLVIRPLRAINVATERAAEGDLASPINLQPRNEFGHVARSFNRMLERLQNSREELELKVAELEATNRELHTTRNSLVRSEKLASVGHLAAGIAHEIGNPLAALSGYNELLMDEDLDPEVRHDILVRSGSQLERIRGVIRNLLDFSREEASDTPAPVNLGSAVEEAISLVRALPKARSVELAFGELEGPPVEAVHSKVVQVLVNLCINALDALEGTEGTRVTIERFEHEGRTDLVVSDDGPGISAELHTRIFDPFFTTKDPGDGTGLGLAICARIMESFGGEIELTPSERGARFVLSFPRWEAA